MAESLGANMLSQPPSTSSGQDKTKQLDGWVDVILIRPFLYKEMLFSSEPQFLAKFSVIWIYALGNIDTRHLCDLFLPHTCCVAMRELIKDITPHWVTFRLLSVRHAFKLKYLCVFAITVLERQAVFCLCELWGRPSWWPRLKNDKNSRALIQLLQSWFPSFSHPALCLAVGILLGALIWSWSKACVHFQLWPGLWREKDRIQWI